jgi:transposase
MVRQLSEVVHLALFPDVEPWPPAREVIDCDLIVRLYEEFGISVSDDTVYRTRKSLGFSHISARPKATNAWRH